MSYSSEVLADSPVVYYRQGDASGTTMADSSGSSRDATYLGAPTLGVTGALVGDSDTAVNYNGGAQYGSAGTAAQTALKAISGPFTLEAWVKVSTTSGNRAILDRYGTGASTDSVFLWYIVSGKPTFIVRNASNADASLAATTNVTTGTWTYLVATYDGTNMRVYKDGVLDCTPFAATFSSHNRIPTLNIGRLVFSGATYAGDLDEVAVYSTALSGTRIAAHYAAGMGATGATVNAVAATATATAPAPVVSAQATVTAVAATATAAAPPPAVTGTGDGTVLAVAATATAAAQAPTLGADATVSAVAASASALAPAPTLALSSTVLAVAATATADALAPAVSDGSGSRTVFAVPATATAAALSPVWTQGFEAGTDTTNARHGRRRLGRATVTITRPVAALPPTLVLSPKVDKAAAYPVPTMVEGRPT